VVLFVVASTVASTALAGPGRRVLRRLLPVVYANVVEAVVLVLLIGVFLWMAARWLDHRPIVDYGFHLSRAWWLDLGFGLALGVFLMAGVYALALALGWVKVTGILVSPPGQPFIGAILADVVVVVGIAGWEEIVFRSYLIKNLAEGLNSKIIGGSRTDAAAWACGHPGWPDLRTGRPGGIGCGARQSHARQVVLRLLQSPLRRQAAAYFHRGPNRSA
jgi:membrane protease YdiL (CAAX protease family)